MCRRLSFLVYQATFSLKPRNREVYLSLSLSLSVFLSLPVSLALSLSLFFSLAFLCFLCLACLEQGSTMTGSRSIRRHQSSPAPHPSTPTPFPFLLRTVFSTIHDGNADGRLPVIASCSFFLASLLRAASLLLSFERWCIAAAHPSHCLTMRLHFQRRRGLSCPGVVT